MKYKLYESYGVLAHEKTPVYSDTVPATEHTRVITVEMPYPLSENALGDTLIDIDGSTYLLREVLTAGEDGPELRWFDGHRTHRVPLNYAN